MHDKTHSKLKIIAYSNSQQECDSGAKPVPWQTSWRGDSFLAPYCSTPGSDAMFNNSLTALGSLESGSLGFVLNRSTSDVALFYTICCIPQINRYLIEQRCCAVFMKSGMTT